MGLNIFFFKKLYQKWMNFAEQLNKFMLTVVFSGIYFLFLPFLKLFIAKDRLRFNAHKNSRTLWLKRSQTTNTLEDMQHMG